MRLLLRISIFVFVYLFLIGAVFAAPSHDARSRSQGHTKSQAERNLLKVVSLKWAHRRIADLVDPRTNLLRDNVRAICRGTGRGVAGSRYRSFNCQVRPWPTARRQELFVTYRVIAAGSFRVHLRLIRR
jgi:hypothetical protein